MISKIFPRNLTARAAVQVVGNPVTSRLESGVGNCFPGLEFDHRNLDRRFFVGLVFEFTDLGVRLIQVNANDPDLEEGPLHKMLTGDTGTRLGEGAWYLDVISQGGKSIAMSQDGAALDLMVAWRLVHSLEPGKVTIELRQRAQQAGERVSSDTISLTGNRRTFVGPSGVIGTVYAPGELTKCIEQAKTSSTVSLPALDVGARHIFSDLQQNRVWLKAGIRTL
jgi:hypothetical protein